MAIKGFDPTAIHFDVMRGAQTNGELGAWLATNSGQVVTGRMRMNMASWAQGVLTVLAQAELIAAFALQQPLVVTGGIPVGMVLGGSMASMRQAVGDPKMKPACDAYFAVVAWARRIPMNIDPAYKNDLLFMPSAAGSAAVSYKPGLRSDATQQAVSVIWVVAAVSVALAAVAACAYWAGKREDAQASVQLGTLKATATLDAATKLALVQIAAGQPVDPQLYDVFKAAGTETEQRHGLWTGVAAGGAGALVVGGAAGAIYSQRDGK